MNEPAVCTGERSQAPEWFGEVMHDKPCPVHPDVARQVKANRSKFYGGRR